MIKRTAFSHAAVYGFVIVSGMISTAESADAQTRGVLTERGIMQQMREQPNSVVNNPETLTWTERGPDGDFPGMQGIPRPAGEQTSGRIRAMMVDSLDPSRKTIWAGSPGGGLWKTTDITSSPSPWQEVSNISNNLAVSGICQDPRPGFQHIMYYCTGDAFLNAGSIQGNGVYKSTDGGITWNHLSATAVYTNCTKILCDYQGNIFLSTLDMGLNRSTDGGSSWVNITPAGLSSAVIDFELSTASGPGRLHIVTGAFSPGPAQGYRFTDNPATVSVSAGWNSAASPFPATWWQRAELACMGTMLYALPCNNSGLVPVIYKSTDGGNTWAPTAAQPPNSWATPNPYLNLSCGMNPANTEECIIGGGECYKTTNGGISWTKISSWNGSTGTYIPNRQQSILWWDGGTKLLFGSNGGVYYSTDGGATAGNRNKGLRVKQFFSVALHPSEPDYFLGGTADHGIHRLNHAGLDSSVEVYGGDFFRSDGGFVAIDQDEPQYQFASGDVVTGTAFRRSTDGGATWNTPLTLNIPVFNGRYPVPWDYDHHANIMYLADGFQRYRRWENPATTNTTAVINVPGFSSTDYITAIHVSPHTPGRVYFGTGFFGKIYKVDAANTATPAATDISPTGSSGDIRCIVTGSSDQHLLACNANYGAVNIWVSGDGGTTWTGIDGNLPDMPVRWVMFHPDADTKAYIATEAGIWETDLINGAGTVWSRNTTFPPVRTDMIKYRSSDRTIAAATHGRGIWSAIIPGTSGYTLSAAAPAPVICPAPAVMQAAVTAAYNGTFVNNVSLSASGNPPGTAVLFSNNPLTSINPVSTITLNGVNMLPPGTYTITVTGTSPGLSAQAVQVMFIVNPGSGPVINAHPVSQAACTGASVTLSVAATGTTGYQWQQSNDGGLSWVPVTGATAASYVINNVVPSDASTYRCLVYGQCGTSISNAVVLTVNTPPVILVQPQGNTICAGTVNTFSVSAAGTGLTYQWQGSASCSGSFSDIAGATLPVLSITPAATAAYRCIVTGSCAPPEVSSCALLTVVSPVTITADPLSTAVCRDGNTSFTAAGTGGSLVYQWQLSINGGLSWSDISGAVSAVFNISGATAAMHNNRYRCVISNTVCSAPAITSAAVLTVNRPAEITLQPFSVTVCSGSSNTFCIAATGDNLLYQWETAASGCAGNWIPVNGAVSPCLVVNGTSTAAYRCRVSSIACGNTVTSNCAVYTVASPVLVSVHPSGRSVCSGSEATFSVTGNSSAAISYQWQLSNDGGTGWVNITNSSIYSGANGPVLAISAATTSMNTNQYRCLLFTSGCSIPATSSAATLTVRPLPAAGLVAGPHTALLPGQTTTLTAFPAMPGGGTITTSWLFNGQPVINTGNTRTVNAEQTGNYQVQVQETWPGGLICFSQSAIVTISAAASMELFIFPNPNDGRFTLSYYNSGGSSQRRIIIYNQGGSMVYSRDVLVSGAYTMVSADLRKVSTGIYYVVLLDSENRKLASGKLHIR